MLLEEIVDQLIVFDGEGNVRHFLGTYSEYVEECAKNAGAAATPPPPAAKPQAAKGGKKTAASNGQSGGGGGGGGGGGALTKLNHRELESRIVKIEAEIEEIDGELADPDVYRDGEKMKRLQGKREKLQARLVPLEEEWVARADT